MPQEEKYSESFGVYGIMATEFWPILHRNNVYMFDSKGKFYNTELFRAVMQGISIDVTEKKGEDFIDVDDESFDERSAALSNVLDELIQAFERQDRVLIGDLIEYEIAPETEVLAKILEQIQSNVKGKSH